MNTNNNINDNVKTFMSSVKDYISIANSPTITTLNKYMVSVENELDENKIENLDDSVQESLDDTNIENSLEEDVLNEDIDVKDEDITDDNISNQISTLYSLSCDIESSCEDFCELKEELTNAIVETENMIKKIQDKELSLSTEQKMFVVEQSNQLKTLSRELTKLTNELSLQLTDLNDIATLGELDPDQMNLRYLVVLNNIMNGNELLTNSLLSLRMLNHMAYLNNTNTDGNNTAKILYGFQRNNEAPIIKEYEINEEGNISETTPEVENDTEEDKSVDSYTNTKLNTNIDTYGTNYKNIDTFFNTALLDNEFMYGAGGYPMNGLYGMNPYMNQYNQYTQLNDQIENDNQTNVLEEKNENIDKNNIKTQENISKNQKKSKFTKNIDTYRNENTPDLRSRISNIKSSIKGFFSKISPEQDSIKNPIFRENED
ncbi:MAG: hypothetical protein IKC49_03075 [Clostridia bacterium]|nr:hypothetical protein [Clostridia bacterium]